LTPYQTRIAVAGLQDSRTILSWQIAALSRQKNLPRLDGLLLKKQKKVTDLKYALMGFKGEPSEKRIR
jgi:hypothetical protein